MKRYLAMLGLLVSGAHPSIGQQYCGAIDTSSSMILPTLSELPDTMSLAVIFVDFPDGRDSVTGLPPLDTLDLLRVKNLNAVGSFGWSEDPQFPGNLIKHVRKYVYEDYWAMLFSDGGYIDIDSLGVHPHPDWDSHGIKVYGSMRDYYDETSYGNFTLSPVVTHGGSNDMYHTGIVNNIDTSNGKNYLRWIQLDNVKSYYAYAGSPLLDDAIAKIVELHLLNDGDPDYVEFDTTGFRGKYVIIGAGAHIGGWTYLNYYAYGASEKPFYLENSNSESTFDGILQNVHEFGHTIGLQHVARGSYDPMHYGGMAPEYKD